MMVDAAGCATDKVKLSYDSSSKTVTIKPDRKWLESEAREYPVRIDPETTLVTPSQKVSYDYDLLNSLVSQSWFAHSQRWPYHCCLFLSPPGLLQSPPGFLNLPPGLQGFLH